MDHNNSKWLARVVSSTPPGRGRYLLVQLSEAAVGPYAKIDNVVRADCLRDMGMTGEDIRSLLSGAEEQGWVRIWRADGPRSDMLVELLY